MLMRYGCKVTKKFALSGGLTNSDADTITEELAKGKVIIACMGPGDFTTQGHFIVLTKVTGSGKIVVNDPNSKKRSKQTWDVDRLVAQMKDMWVYQ